MTPPNVEEIDRIARVSDPTLRNLQITQCYYELSQCVAERNGFCANWCTFATWASCQAGQTIRQEDLIRAFEERFFLSPEISAALEQINAELIQLGARLQAGFFAKQILQRSIPPRHLLGRATPSRVVIRKSSKKSVLSSLGFCKRFAPENGSIAIRRRTSVPRFVPETRRTDSGCSAKRSRPTPRRQFRTASRKPS